MKELFIFVKWLKGSHVSMANIEDQNWIYDAE